MPPRPDPAAPAPDAERMPTRRQAALFFGKTWGLRALRAWRDFRRGRPRRFPALASPADDTLPLLAESRSPLYASSLPAEFALQAGKAQNLRAALARLDGLALPAGEVFSFWAHVPRPTRRAGFAPGRELREGCVVPSVGGGLCQLSNALYDAALAAGFEIVERHAHSRRLPGSMAEAGRDATVFWNYVDLRFRPSAACRLEARLTRTELLVRFRALTAAIAPQPASSALHPSSLIPHPSPQSCETCGVSACFRHPVHAPHASGVTAWLVDAHWPEHDQYLRAARAPGDWLFLPLAGRRYGLRAYLWDATGFARVRQAPLATLRRSWASRRLAAQGAARQRALLRFDAALAGHYARRLPAAATHLVVSQNLLPFLWQSGALGGRTFDVLMTRLPLAALQATLDRAAALHPGSPTLADFRADPALAAAEGEALAEASLWITPHRAVAALADLAGTRAHLLPWHVPAPDGRAESGQPTAGNPVCFPASTLGRKGAYELRAAARALGLRVLLGGPALEGPGFWEGVDTAPAGPDDWRTARAVALPAWVENQPRRLLAAVAAGVPVIASEACGLAGVPGVVTIPAGDPAALQRALAAAAPPG